MTGLFDSLSLEFTFEPKYYFECQNCGACCHAEGGVSLTEREYRTLRGSFGPESFRRANHPAFPYLLSSEGGCRFLKDNRCRIHGDHPVFCRMIPRGFGCHGNLVFVNLIHCKGVDTETRGLKVDQHHIRELLYEMARVEGEEFITRLFDAEKRLTLGYLPLFEPVASTTFEQKRSVFLAVASWLTHPLLRDLEEGSTKLRVMLLGPLGFLKGKVRENAQGGKQFADGKRGSTDVNSQVVQMALADTLGNLSPLLHRGLKKSCTSPGQAEVLQTFDPETGEVKRLGPNDDIVMPDYYDMPVKLKVHLALKRAAFAPEAMSMEVSYIQEVLRRVGLGGIPYYLPLDNGIHKLQIATRQLETYAKYLMHKAHEEEIGAQIMKESIRNIDTHLMDLLL